jgi:hypothetical protein
MDGSVSPEMRTFSYNADRWSLCMDWMERRASIDLLRGMKAGEPPLSDVERHAAWQEHYDHFKEKVTGFIKMRAMGVVDDPETVYFVVTLFLRLKKFSESATEFLQVSERPSLGEAERLPETEVVLGDPDGA